MQRVGLSKEVSKVIMRQVLKMGQVYWTFSTRLLLAEL